MTVLKIQENDYDHLLSIIRRYEKALREILSITEDTPELEVYTTIVKEALQEY